MSDWPENEAFDPVKVAERLSEILEPGLLLPHSEVWLHVGVKEPDENAPWRMADEQRLLKVNRWEAVRQLLLTRYCIDLESAKGLGYMVLSADQQVEAAMVDTRRSIQARLAKGQARAKHARLDELSDEAKAMRADGLSRMERLATAVRKQRSQIW